VRNALAVAGVRDIAIESFNRSSDGTVFKMALAGLNNYMKVTRSLEAIGPAAYVTTRRSADALTYQAATGLLPGWYTLESENVIGSKPLRFFAREDGTVGGSVTVLARDGSYDFIPSQTKHLTCSVVVDVDPNAPTLSPKQRLENAAKALH
jgi:hypothetical protein